MTKLKHAIAKLDMEKTEQITTEMTAHAEAMQHTDPANLDAMPWACLG